MVHSVVTVSIVLR